MQPISFGTDGWRGIIARDFTFDRVRLVAAAVADYLEAQGLAPRPVVVGYDRRFLSEHFAGEVAGVLTGRGIPVYMAGDAMPTPVAAFTAVHRNAAGAVMITASHNPPEYSGVKFIPHYGGPALPEITKEIEENIRRRSSVLSAGEESGDHQAHCNTLRQEVDPLPPYLEQLASLVDFPAIGRSGLQIVADPMYGAGIGYLERALTAAGAGVKTVHGNRDPLFGGHLPDPSEKFLFPLREEVLAQGAALGLALDGDADRFGLIDQGGTFIAPNLFLALLYHYLLVVKKWQGPATRSVATTHLLDRVAQKYGQSVLETPVGFKYIGQNLARRGCILGGEESGGLSVRGHVPEKDGILAGLLAAEMVAVTGASLVELARRLMDEVGYCTSKRVDFETSPDGKKQVLERLAAYNPDRLGGRPVLGRKDLDGVKFVMQDGSWILIRASGTEPVFRLYAEAGSADQLDTMIEEVKGALPL